MMKKRSGNTRLWTFIFLVSLSLLTAIFLISGTVEEEYEPIDSSFCVECHETGKYETLIAEDLTHSIHDGFECLDCHQDKNTFPHKEVVDFDIRCSSCMECHVEQAEEYTAHGRFRLDECGDIPFCADCHGDHDILPSSVKNSKAHPLNVPQTCGKCHEDLNLTEKYEILINHPIDVYENSVHGRAIQEGSLAAATCSDCHSTRGTAHRIFSPRFAESTINHFNIPGTCGKCHEEITQEYNQSIHGKMVERNETDAPVCTDCHGEHGIISPSDPRSPVSKTRVAEATCAPCHESITLTEKYGLQTDRLPSFIDSYHGLKSKAGDLFVANCASCHGYHKILPSSDPESSVNKNNLKATCGECHPNISAELALTPIHQVGGKGIQTRAATIVQIIYIAAIVIIIGLMALHWLIDLFRQIILSTKKPQVRRMRPGEVWQHTLLMVSFIVLVITGFSLRFHESAITRFFFGWQGGFEIRGILHRIAAVVMIVVTAWHLIYLFTRRGRQFLKDMMPKFQDFKDFIQKILFNLGLSKKTPQFKRFSYIEKAEYWALIWGNAVMILTGILLWFDNFFIGFLPKGFLDVALVIHYYEAILASLAILIWHLYSTVFNPKVYPMNPSWLTGKMPEDMFKHEHPAVKDQDIEKV